MFRITIVLAAFICLLVFAFQNALGAPEVEKKIGNYICKIYSDGSGLLGLPQEVKDFNDTWALNIRRDKITDKLIVTAQRYAYTTTSEFGEIKLETDISLWLNLSNPKSEYLCVAGHNFPGKQAVIRVDRNAPILTNEKGCVRITRNLDDQLLRGKEIVIRGYHWPYEGAETQTIKLGGYSILKKCLKNKEVQ